MAIQSLRRMQRSRILWIGLSVFALLTFSVTGPMLMAFVASPGESAVTFTLASGKEVSRDIGRYQSAMRSFAVVGSLFRANFQAYPFAAELLAQHDASRQDAAPVYAHLVLSAIGEEAGFDVPRREVDQFLRGTFGSSEQWNGYLRAYRLRPADVREWVRRWMVVDRVAAFLAGAKGVPTPEEVVARWKKDQERLTVETVAFDPKEFEKSVAEPTEEALAAFFEGLPTEEKKPFESPKKVAFEGLLRRFDGPESPALVALLEGESFEEEALREHYSTNSWRYVPETPRSDAPRSGQGGDGGNGESGEGENGGTTGEQEPVEEPVQEPVVEKPAAEVSAPETQPAATETAPATKPAPETRPAGPPPFDEVRDRVLQEVRAQRAMERVLEEARKGEMALRELGEKYGLEFAERPVASFPEAVKDPGEFGVSAVLAAFGLDAGKFSERPIVTKEAVVFTRVTQVVPAGIPEFAEIRDKVAEEWRKREGKKAAEDAAKRFREEVLAASGEEDPFAARAAERAYEVLRVGPFPRRVEGDFAPKPDAPPAERFWKNQPDAADLEVGALTEVVEDPLEGTFWVGRCAAREEADPSAMRASEYRRAFREERLERMRRFLQHDLSYEELVRRYRLTLPEAEKRS